MSRVLLFLPVNNDGLAILYPDLLSHVRGHAMPVPVLLQKHNFSKFTKNVVKIVLQF
jgi:hypothetical protein